ncbi:MAG: hypothetical protein ACREV0_03215 [Burkholderiales bacterium]
MLNSKLTRVAIAVTFALVAPQSFAGQSSWLQEQLSISDGYSPANGNAGPQGKQGFTPTANSSWLDQQLAISDGYSPFHQAAGTVYVGAKFEPNSNDSFMERGRRISDGTTE